MIDRTTPPDVKDFTSLSIPELNVEKLQSGVEIHYLDVPATDVLEISAIFNSGEIEGCAGGADRLVLPLMGEGSWSHPDGQLTELLEYYGTRVRIKSHDHHSEFSFGVLKSVLNDVAPLIREYIYSPMFSGRSIEVYRENAAQAYLLALQKVNFHAERLMSAHIFGAGHPRAGVLTDKDYMAVRREDVIEAHKRIISSPVTVYVAGAVDEYVKGSINRIFDNCVDSSLSVYNIIPYVGDGLGMRYCYKMDDKMQSCVNMSLPTVGREHPDYILLRNLIIALGGYFGGRLMSNIREDKGLTYGISAALYGTPEGAYASINSMTANENVEALIRETQHEIDRLSDEVLGMEEFAIVRSYILSQLASMLDTPLNILQYHLSLKTAFIPDADYFNRQFITVRDMTPESLRDIARRHLMGRKWTIAVAGNV